MSQNKSSYGNRCMEPGPDSAIYWSVPQNHLDDRIRRLCAKVVSAREVDSSSMSELKAALREHNQRLRKLALAQLGRLWSSPTDLAQYESQ